MRGIPSKKIMNYSTICCLGMNVNRLNYKSSFVNYAGIRISKILTLFLIFAGKYNSHDYLNNISFYKIDSFHYINIDI